MENFAHTLTTMAAEDQQAANTILMNFDGNQLSVISDVVDGELVTIGNIDGVFENVVVLPNNSTPNASPEKEGGCPTNSPEKAGGPNVFPRGRRDPGTPKPPPTCDLCQKTFSQRKGYSKHMRRIHKVPPKPIEKATEAEKTCNICDKKFLTRAAANLHVLRVHNPLGLSPTYKCTECNYETFNKPLFQRHTIRKHLLKVQKQPKEAVEVACETCGKVFNTKGKLNTHVNNKHFPKRIFECDQCDYKTPTKSAWQRHMVRRHIFRKSERKFKCELCNSSYILERYLKRHMKGVHNVELASSVHKKKCPLCPFVSHKLYRDEMLSHFRDTHAIQITTEKLVFDDMESFVKWRKQVEQTTNSQYRGDYSLEARTKWHNCNRSGHYDYSKAAQLSSVYSTIKLNAFCPSAIHTKRLDNTGRVEVEYWPVHVGHDPNEEEDKRKTFVNNLSGTEVPGVMKKKKKKATTTSAGEDGVEVMTVEENDEGFVGFEAVEKAATATKAKFNSNYDKLVKETLNNDGATIRPVGKAFNGSADLPLTYKCGYCSFRTTTQIACQNHVRNHANHVCGLCDFRTTDNAKLKAHHSLKHSSLLKCPHCSKTFLHRRTRNIHVDTVHKGYKELTCDHCPYKTLRKENLLSHLKHKHKIAASFNCKLCNASFQVAGHLRKHEKLEHSLAELGGELPFRCSECDAPFRHRRSMHLHEQRVHRIVSTGASKQCPMCAFVSTNKSRFEMHLHLKDVHKIELTSEKFVFNDMASFCGWKGDLETATGSLFNGRQGFKTRYYMCLKSRRTVQEEKEGVVTEQQVAAFCPCEIQVTTTSDGQLLAEYWPLHIGHETPDDVNRPLSVSCVNAFTATQLNINAKYMSVVNNETVSDTHSYSKKPDEELFDVAWIVDLKANPNTRMLHVKPTNVLSNDFPTLQADDYFLIYMSYAQKDRLTDIRDKTIFVDKASNILTDLHVYTILVVDDSKVAYPVMCMFTNRCDEVVLSVLFKKLKLSFGCLTPKAFMSNIEDADTYLTWSNIMGSAKKHVYSTLHVLRAWKKNLDKIASKDNREHVFSVLKSLLCEVDGKVFHELLDEITKSLMFENEDYFKYFNENFVANERYKQWANCFVGDTDVSFDGYERILKQCYLIGLATPSLNKVLQLLVQTFTNSTGDWTSDSVANINQKLATIRKTHKNSLVLSCRSVRRADNCSTWVVKCSTATTKQDFVVVKKVAECATCELVCNKCDTCVHEYVCSCWGNAMRNNMCVHLHLVARSLLSSVNDESEIELVEDDSEEEDDDEEGEEMVIHCGSLLNSKSADGNSDEEEYNTYEVSDSDNDDGLDIEDVTGVKQLKQTPKLVNEPIQKDGIVHVDVPPVSKISSDAILVVKGKSSTPLKIINKRDIEDNALIKVVEGSQRSADGIRILKVVSGGGDKDQSENTLEGKQLIISKDVKVVKVGNTDKEGVSKQVSNAVLGTTSQTPLKIVDVQSINRRYSFGTEDKKQDNVVISSKAQCTAQVKNVDSQSIRSSPGNVSRTENEKQDIVVSSSKANSTAQVKNVDSQSIRSSPANVSRTEDEKQDIVVISSKAQSTAQVKNVDSQSIRSAQGNESRTEDKKQDKVVISNKVQSTAQVKIVDSKSIRSAQGNVSRTEDKKQDKVVISSKAQSTAQVKNVDSKSIRSSPGNVSRTEDKKQDNVVISSKAQSTAQVKIVDSQSIRSAQGNVSRTEDEKQDNVVISSKAKSLAQVKIVDSKSIRSSPGSVSRTGDKKQDNVVISSKAQCTTQVNNVDSKSIRSSQGNVSRTEEKNQDIVVITDKVQSTSQVPVKIGNSKSIKSSPENVTRTEDEETDVEVILEEVTNEETVAGLEEPPPEFEENVIKFVEFCQKKAKSKEQMEYIKKMMQKVMADADL